MTSPRTRLLYVSLALIVATAAPALSQTRVKPGFNLFSVEQDQEMGRQSAQEVEKQLPMLNDRNVVAYVNRVGQRLSAQAPGAKYPYQFKVVNVSDINAFALPGGYLYLNRGLIEAARSEGELAGVMAHEIAHVALRHGTNQTSKTYLSQAGLGLLGGLIGKGDAAKQDRIATVGGFGLSALFLKFSRTDEEQADIVGAQTMARAGYDPADMVSFFQLLADKNNREPSKVQQFFSSHPQPADRAARISRERTMLAMSTQPPVGGFSQVRSSVARMRPAPTMAQVTKGIAAQAPASPSAQPASATLSDRNGTAINIDRPSGDVRQFQHPSRLYEIPYPANWRAYPSSQGYGVTIAPDGGLIDTGQSERQIVYGVIVNHYDPFGDDADQRFGDRVGTPQDRASLSEATTDLVRQIRRTNPSLTLMSGSERRDTIDGAPSLSVVLTGTSAVTRREERVTVFTRGLPDDHVLYALFIAPGQDYEALKGTFNRMISGLRVGDEQHVSEAHDDHFPASNGSSNSQYGSLPSGTVLTVELEQTLTSEESQAGDRFTARVTEPVQANGRIVIPTGSIVTGQVVNVVPAKKIGGRAQLDLQFSSLQLPSGRSRPITASFVREGKNEMGQDAARIGGGAAAGALLGRLLGKDSKSTVIGAVVGAAVGTGVAARSEGESLQLPAGMALRIQLESAFEL